jgi:hypothetical protein
MHLTNNSLASECRPTDARCLALVRASALFLNEYIVVSFIQNDSGE